MSLSANALNFWSPINAALLPIGRPERDFQHRIMARHLHQHQDKPNHMLKCSLLLPTPRNFFHIPCQQVRRLSAAYDAIVVPCAANGSVQLKVYHPAISSSPGRVAIFLPRGPVSHNPEHDVLNVEKLRATLPCHVVQINYRYGSQHRYPTPIHDVLAGFDWVVSNLLPKRAITRLGRSEHVGKLAVCGELLGGSLATALALTECRTGEPGIVAAAVNNPITDWVELGEDGNTADSGPRRLSVETLLDQRSKLFRKSEHYYDPFASPALFFRTAGYEIPEDVSQPSMCEMDELARLERIEYFSQQQQLVGTVEKPDTKDLSPVTITRVKQRKSSRRYPPKAFGLRLPSFSITAGKDSRLIDQAGELAKLLEKSFDRQSKPGSSDDSITKVHYQSHSDLALWDATVAGRDRMQDAADWIAEELSA